MPWVRIDENAIDHPKFLALSDGAWRLWCEGQTYCQKHLTDGRIGLTALKRFRYYSPSRVKNLTTEHVLGKGPCWHQDAAGNIQVHDYLDWNDSAAEVLEAREAAKGRRRRYNEKNASVDASATPNVSCDVGSSNGRSAQKPEGGAGETKPDAVRVARFVDRYRDLHEEYIGVAYLGNPQKDYWAACELVTAFDDALLEKIAVYGLNDQDAFMANGTRTITKLKSRASEYAATLKAKRLA